MQIKLLVYAQLGDKPAHAVADATIELDSPPADIADLTAELAVGLRQIADELAVTLIERSTD